MDTKGLKDRLDKLGFILCNEYVNLESPVIVQCKKCNTSKEYLQAKTCIYIQIYCKTCSGPQPRLKYTLEFAIKACNENNVKFLDSYFGSSNEIHRFECEKGHIWSTKFYHLHKIFQKCINSNGCYVCSHERQKNKISDIVEKLKNLNIEFLDEKYINNMYRHTFRCIKCKNIWKGATGLIANGFSGCPKCTTRLNEKTLGTYLNELLPDIEITQGYFLNEKIIRKKKIIRHRLFIDYVFQLGDRIIFVEYNGHHHFEPIDYSGHTSNKDVDEKLVKQKIRDRWLRKYCKQNNIYLIEIDGRKYKGIKIKEHLKKRLAPFCIQSL